VTISMREAYGRALAQLGETNSAVVVLDADLAKSTRSKLFQDKFPHRFFNVGIAEQNMVSVAAGLSLRGLIPFTNTFAFAAAFRSADQIRTSLAYPKLNVKVVGHTGGLSPAWDGPSHQENSDLAVMRSLPNMNDVRSEPPIIGRFAAMLEICRSHAPRTASSTRP